MDRVRALVHWDHMIEKNKDKNQKVNIAILDTGLVAHPDLAFNIRGFVDCVGSGRRMYDDNGHGTHVAGIASGTGVLSGGKYMGIAPCIGIYAIKVLDYNGDGKTEHLLKGIDWVIKNHRKLHIRIANLSVGTLPSYKTEEDNRLIDAVERLWDEGVVVVAAAGNYGPEEGSITIPGVSKSIITVGAVDDQVFINRKGIVKYNYSGRGVCEDILFKPDILAPGSYIKSCNNTWMNKNKKTYYTVKSGTSMATPVVSGAVALLLSEFPELTNEEVKLRICTSAYDLHRPLHEQGCGLLNIEALLLPEKNKCQS